MKTIVAKNLLKNYFYLKYNLLVFMQILRCSEQLSMGVNALTWAPTQEQKQNYFPIEDL